MGNQHLLGHVHTEEARRKMSIAKKGCYIPWNKGVKAWNNGLYWPNEVRENISRGMIVYWQQRKEQQQQQQQQ